MFPLLKQRCPAPICNIFGDLRNPQGLSDKAKEKLPEAAKMQHLKWHQAPMFMMLDQAQHASTELAFPIKEKEDFKGR